MFGENKVNKVESCNQTLISVIMSAYNHENYVKKTVISLLNQSYENIELIIIDDGSSDGTYKKILELRDECVERFKRFICYTRNNRGLAASLNEALKQTQGEYIFVIGSDDIVKPDALKLLLQTLRENTYAKMVIPDLDLIDAKGDRLFLTPHNYHTKDITKAGKKTWWDVEMRRALREYPGDAFGTYPTLLKGNYYNIGYLIEKKTLLEIGAYDETLAVEDYPMFLNFSKKYKACITEQAVLDYRLHETNVSRNWLGIVEFLLATLDREKSWCYEHGYEQIWEKRYYDLKLEHRKRAREKYLLFKWKSYRKAFGLFGYILFDYVSEKR